MKKTLENKILEFNTYLSRIRIELPKEYKIINPFNGSNKEKINDITKKFYHKFYNDNKKRILILGSSPARRGTAATGIPFEDNEHLYKTTGISIDDFYINKSSSNFLYEVIDKYGGSDRFYSIFYMNFICPLGIVRTSDKGNEVNCNYYENKELLKALYPFIVESLKKQIELGIDTSIVYCIGSGENYKFLNDLNNKLHLFKKIIPLEHPRYIMQYNSNKKEEYIKKYIELLKEE
ncbi:MAG: SMUG2 DNA glycosylase family protein [Bacilli bacterium]|nr:SMUG2 DNA glycosylase family protein [Bacilli bacterium]